MKLEVEKSNLMGTVAIPPSKSHTIRAVALASLAEGTSQILNPLMSEDAQAAVRFYESLGAKIHLEEDRWLIEGAGDRLSVPDNVIDVGNSGTTCRIGIGSAALCRGYSVVTGDVQTRKRPMESLLNALNELGAEAFSTRGNGCLPAVVGGRLKGGETTVDGFTSQFLTSLLLNCPLAEGDSVIHVTDLRERPYVDMTRITNHSGSRAEGRIFLSPRWCRRIFPRQRFFSARPRLRIPGSCYTGWIWTTHRATKRWSTI